ncbi:GNAT family N-acetyltransferase [Sediminispirochaeta smaragdinae]|uniref:GCN5-related N-acetyltransferase n=1 Tax=Sediminispirochaeta smaragdinae (strain DSM 11293 / JCM 15392 / SEBR 4228) TaxID=573413 RepID=E1R9X6_SEDSS|nr:GNAT family N-acetyltransferase [Sediminispirochaeta smaragdinae]ADK83295.1 GCN5-related N-acetyltransferase [Sediminispirochaeta smaragdinae DSM 11293]
MEITIREFTEDDIDEMIPIWNDVVEEGMAFPQTEYLTPASASVFFGEQSFTGVAVADNRVAGLYILHPNNIGRCGHIANASYAVGKEERGKHIGELLVRHSIKTGGRCGFRILQFNAVVATNHAALHLYKKLGFSQLGTIPEGFLAKNNEYLDIIPHYIKLANE